MLSQAGAVPRDHSARGRGAGLSRLQLTLATMLGCSFDVTGRETRASLRLWWYLFPSLTREKQNPDLPPQALLLSRECHSRGPTLLFRDAFSPTSAPLTRVLLPCSTKAFPTFCYSPLRHRWCGRYHRCLRR